MLALSSSEYKNYRQHSWQNFTAYCQYNFKIIKCANSTASIGLRSSEHRSSTTIIALTSSEYANPTTNKFYSSSEQAKQYLRDKP